MHKWRLTRDLKHLYKLKVTHWSIQRLLCFHKCRLRVLPTHCHATREIEPETRENTMADMLTKALIEALAATLKCRPRH